MSTIIILSVSIKIFTLFVVYLPVCLYVCAHITILQNQDYSKKQSSDLLPLHYNKNLQ